MSRDSKFVLIYSIIVAVMTLLYVGYEDLNFLNHAKATPAAMQVEAADE